MEKSRFMQFSGLVGSAMKSIQAMKGIKMTRYGLSAAHTNLLCRLAEAREGMTQGELARAEMLDKAQVSRVLRELEEKGYVAPTAGGGAYRRRYCMTPAGRAVTDEMEQIILGLNRYVSREIPDEDLRVFYRTLTTITENLLRLEQLVEDGKEEDLYA